MHALDLETTTRGAKVVVEKCLQPARGERVHVLSFHGGSIAKLIERALREAGAAPVHFDLDAHDRDQPVPELMAKLAPLLAGATAVIFAAPVRPPQTLSLSVAKTCEAQGARLLYLLQVDERVLAQSARADPDLLATVNGRLIAALAPPKTIRVTSEAGTDLELQLSAHHPLLAASGRPGAGSSENLPAGYVYVHPARVTGVLVVDRAMFGPKGDVDRAALRRTPVRTEFAAGRLTRHDGKTPAIAAVLDPYLASHASAGRVGLAVIPTNYLVRTEIGSDRQDMLLPGLAVSLGFANADKTGATYEAPVQLVLLGRRQTVEVGGRKLIDAGRFENALVEGIDPFR
jgi:leucyl aminopeptidase (aminopeptidase T)